MQEITRNVANVFSFLCNNSDQTCFINALTFTRSLGGVENRGAEGLGFQHLPRDLANVNA